MILVNGENDVDHAERHYGVAKDLTLPLCAGVQRDCNECGCQKGIDVDCHPADAEAEGGIDHAENDQYNRPGKCGTFTKQSSQAPALPPAIKGDQGSENRYVGGGVEFGERVAAGLIGIE